MTIDKTPFEVTTASRTNAFWSACRASALTVLSLALAACSTPVGLDDASSDHSLDASSHEDSAPDSTMDGPRDAAATDSAITEDAAATDSDATVDTGVALDASSSDSAADAAPDSRPDALADVATDAGCRAVCSGRCIDTLTDALHCGACDNACAVPVNGAAACVFGACQLRCDPGYFAVGSRCDPLPAPRPIAPLSGRWVTSAQPTLRWQNGASTNGARVLICRDPGCTTVIQMIDAPRSSAVRVTMALPSGVFFWRALPMLDSTVGTSGSVVWSFVVQPRPSATRDLVTHQQFDADNDGQPDLLALSSTEPSPSMVEAHLVYTRGARLVQNAAPLRREATLGQPYAVGDINGDGRSDAVVRSATAGGCVYLGAASGMTLDACTSVTVGTARLEYARAIGAGDVNGDGYGDVFVSTGAGTAFVRYGSSAGLGAPRDEFNLPRDAGSSVAQMAVGDFDADGNREIALLRATGSGLASPAIIPIVAGVPSDAGRRFLSWPMLGIATTTSANPVASDVNGDGYQDLVIALRSNDFPRRGGRIIVYLGSATGLPSTPSQIIANPDGGDDLFGEFFDRAGDLDGDGFEDVIVSSPAFTSNTGRVYVYRGSATGLSATPAQTLTGAGTGQYFGQSIVGLGPTDRSTTMGVALAAFLAPTGATARGTISLFVTGGAPLIATAADVANNNGTTTGYGYRMSSISH